jgi:acyl carrier protein
MAERAEIRKTLIDMLENDTGENFPNLNDSASLREHLGLDSVDVVSIVAQVERHFRIRLTHQELEHLVTVGDLLNLLESKVTMPPQPAAA